MVKATRQTKTSVPPSVAARQILTVSGLIGGLHGSIRSGVCGSVKNCPVRNVGNPVMPVCGFAWLVRGYLKLPSFRRFYSLTV